MSNIDKVREILLNELGFDASELNDDAPLFSSGALDSLSSIRLLMALEACFDVSISPLDVSLEDVDTIAKIAVTIEEVR